MQPHKQQGFTTLELLVTMFIIGIMSALVLAFVVSVPNQMIKIQNVSITAVDRQQALTRIAQVLRSGRSITEATGTRLTVYAYFSPGDSNLSQVTYYVDTTTKSLKVERIQAVGTVPNLTYPIANKKTSVLLRNFTPTSSLFSYHDADGNSGPFDATTYKDIKTITVDLSSTAEKASVNLQYKTTVLMRNRKTNL